MSGVLDIPRIAARIQVTDTCWLWDGRLNSKGYGRTGYQGKEWFVHRLSWTLTVGPIPTGLYVCHKCDTPTCVRPDHLFVGTHTDNLRDASRKGRMHPGERHGLALLTNQAVREIRARLGAGERPYLVARDYGVHRNTIYSIKNGWSWRTIQ